MTNEQEKPFLVEVRGLVDRETDLQYADLAEGRTGPILDVTPIVPTFSGNAIRFTSLLETIRPQKDATHVIFHASDEFQATLTLTELDGALLLFQQDGQPLQKGFPVRLLVPNGWSDCLNVKSVVKIEFVQAAPEQKSTFGFKNVVPVKEL